MRPATYANPSDATSPAFGTGRHADVWLNPLIDQDEPLVSQRLASAVQSQTMLRAPGKYRFVEPAPSLQVPRPEAAPFAMETR